MATDPTPTSVSYQGITFDKIGPYYLLEVDGLFGPPDYSSDDIPRYGGPGSITTPQRRGFRLVTLSGTCKDETTRNDLFWALRAAAAPAFDPLDAYPLTVTIAGIPLSGNAQPPKFQPKILREAWIHGSWGFDLQWKLPDPYLYAPPVTATAAIAGPPSGVVYPVTYPITYPAAVPSGQLTLYNPGSAPAPVVYSIFGPVTGPGIITTNKRVTYGFDLASGDILTVDTAAGAAFLNGGYRSPQAGSARVGELVVPPHTGMFVQGLGTAPSGTPTISAVFRPAYW